MALQTFLKGLSETLGFARPEAPSRGMTPQGYNWVSSNQSHIPYMDYYDNVFSRVDAISKRFSTVIPFAVNERLEQITPAPAPLSALYRPNDEQSCLEFLRHLSQCILTQSHVDILIWTRKGNNIQPGGKVTPDNIAGYTFLPLNSRQYTNNRTDYYHRVTLNIDGEDQLLEFTRMETLSLTYGTHPADMTTGISPAMTIRKWANIDDMMADYERGFFGNGAVPSGMLAIVADSQQNFLKTKNQMEDTFRGAGNNNNVVYNYVPTDPLTHQPNGTAKLTWIPFQQSNDTLDLTTLDTVVNNRIANAMAVPDIIMGVDNGQTYANAETATRNFIESTLQPLLMLVWDKWQFELDRITGGLGYGITFKLDLPSQTDVDSVKATTQSTQIDSLLKLVNAGADVADACTALGLPDEYKKLRLTESVQPDSTISIPQLEARSFLASSRLSNEVTIPKDEQPAYELAYKASRHMVEQIISLARREKFDHTDEMTNITLEWLDSAYAAYEPRILAYAKATGKSIAESMEELAKTDADIKALIEDYTPQQLQTLTDWDSLPDQISRVYQERLLKIGRNSADGTYDDIRRILSQAHDDEWTAERIEDTLAQYVDGNRAELLARNEVVNSQRLGALYSAMQMSEDLGVELEKTWNTSHDGKVCEFCNYMQGKRIPLTDSFLDEGDDLTINSTTYSNTFEDIITCSGHPDCRCYATYNVKGYPNG